MTHDRKIYDCFLYNDEEVLLEIRLELLSPLVDRFVVVCSQETFTGLPKTVRFPWHNSAIARFRDRIELVQLDKLEGSGPWQRESFSRNAMLKGLSSARPDDLVIISDIDEIPRPAALEAIARSSERADDMTWPAILGLDYFNFKLNYKMVHGINAVWAGPIVTPMGLMTTPQQLRDGRWKTLHRPGGIVFDAGWHFSYMSASDDVKSKLQSFSHQESEVQSRGDSRIVDLIGRREGFHSHLSPCAVWAVVGTDTYDDTRLSSIVRRHPEYLASEPADHQGDVGRRVKLSVNRMSVFETSKLVRMCSMRDIVSEFARRVRRRLVAK
jgi:beta-1,4-mannosyl-glycoprotein beta-1,4-N-acetylglucosaminyltransferase